MATLTRREFLALSGAAAAGLCLPASGAAAAWLGARRPAESFFTWSELRPGVRAAVDLSMGGNVLALTTPDASLLVDTKFPAFAGALSKEIAAFGSPVRTVVNTHHHGDHTGGNAVLNSDAEIVAHANAAPRIRAQLATYQGQARGGPGQVEMTRPGAAQVSELAQRTAEAAPEWTEDSVAPDRLIEGESGEFEIGGVEVALRHFGAGHTDNDMVVHLRKANVLHTGDLCFNGLHPFFDPSAGVTCRGWSDAVGRALELCDADTVVVPGHGPVGDRSILEAQRRYLDRLWERVSEAVAAGRSREETAAMSWDFMDGLGFEQIRARAIGAVYDEVTRE